MTADIEPGIKIRGNFEKLRQAFDILLDNAQKYSMPGGKTEVSLRRLSKKSALISVSNQGQDISKEDLKNIFKRFYRADEARSGGGYGLGLSIAEAIIHEHRGRIWAESGGGKNTFFIELPL